MDPDAEDLILRLLRLNPELRLGAGEDGSENDLQALKNHPFFKGANFKEAHNLTPPVSEELLEALDDEYSSDKRIDDINLVLNNVKL